MCKYLAYAVTVAYFAWDAVQPVLAHLQGGAL